MVDDRAGVAELVDAVAAASLAMPLQGRAGCAGAAAAEIGRAASAYDVDDRAGVAELVDAVGLGPTEP
jgi:hypothetical protein